MTVISSNFVLASYLRTNNPTTRKNTKRPIRVLSTGPSLYQLQLRKMLRGRRFPIFHTNKEYPNYWSQSSTLGVPLRFFSRLPSPQWQVGIIRCLESVANDSLGCTLLYPLIDVPCIFCCSTGLLTNFELEDWDISIYPSQWISLILHQIKHCFTTSEC